MIPNQQPPSPKTPPRKTTFAYVCYRCNTPGHFIQDCPDNTPRRSPISQPSTLARPDPEFPPAHCQCGAGICGIHVSRSDNNPGRKYYRCPGKYEKNCGYFKWCDQMKKDGVRESHPKGNFPNCGCGAGVCTVRVEDSGPNAGRKYFACPIKRGDGACNFRQWLDDSPHSARIDPMDAATEQNILLDDFELTYEESMQIDALERAICGPPLENAQTESANHEGDTMTARIHERPPEIDLHPVQDCASQSSLHTTQPTTYCASVMVNMQTPVQNHASHNTLHTTPVVTAQGNGEPPLELVQTERAGSEGDRMTDQIGEPSIETDPYPVQKYVSQNTLHSELATQSTIDDDFATFHNPSVQVSTTKCPDHLLDLLLHFLKGHLFKKPGSPGQVADTPPRVTVSEMSPVIKGTFPGFHQLTMRKENVSTASVILEDSSHEGSEGPPGLDDQPWSGLLLNPSGLLKDSLTDGSSMASTILHSFEKSAHHIRNKLITMLDSMDPRDHETMSKEADCTFAALDLLQVDYGLFRMRVTEYINQATALARVEKRPDEGSLDQELIRGYIFKKSCYAEAWDAYLRANDVYKTSSEKLSLLDKKASHFRDVMGEVETELTWCKEENVRHRDNVEQTKKTLLECQTSLEAAYRDALEPLKRHEKREIEKTAAKAAFERARAQLRQ